MAIKKVRQPGIWKLIPRLFDTVRKTHEEVGLVGHHDFTHAARVGNIAYRIALDEWHDEQLALLTGAAGLCHNADRVLQKMFNIGRKDVPKDQIAKLIRSWLLAEYEFRDGPPNGSSGENKRRIITEAVLGHDGLNGAYDGRVLTALMDADRVVNLDLDNIIRSGQLYHDLPAVDYKNWISDPEANYRDPKSVLYDVACSLDWVNLSKLVCVRTRLGMKLAQERARAYRAFIDTLRLQLESEGVTLFLSCQFVD